MNRTSIRIIVALLVALTLLAGGCSKKNEVGGDVTVKGNGKNSSNDLTRGPSTTAAPSTTVAPTKVTTATTAKPVATTVATEKPCTQVRNGAGAVQGYIAIGNANTPFDPRQAGFHTGAVVCWKNTDSISHLVEANNGAFRSGPIAPGAIYRWVANVGPGKINYGDPDRPFAVGELVIQ